MIVVTRWATITVVASRRGRPQRSPQPRVGGQVERRERVVEEVDPRPAYERPGDREPLALAAGEVGAALDHRRVEPLGQRLDEVAGLGDLEGLPQLLLGRVGLAVQQVAAHRAGEQVGLLRDQPDLRPERLRLDAAYVGPAHAHHAGRSRRTAGGRG